MSISPFDSALYRDLFSDTEIAALFTDSAEVRAMMLVEGALANVQGELGVIPPESAKFLHRASMEVQIDPGGLAAATGQNGVSAPALVAAFRKALEAPEHAQYLHWGATSQDIIDTGLVLRLRQSLTLMERRLEALVGDLAALATVLGLSDPGRSWHSTRDGIAELSGWLTLVAGSLGKIGEDMILLAQSELGEIRFGGTGSASTMPQKQNPVGASVLVALARHVTVLNTATQGAAIHGHQRDGAAWFTEWLSLPSIVMGTGKGLAIAGDLVADLEPLPGRMADNLNDPLGFIHAEALSFALAAHLPRPDAQARIKTLCKEAQSTDTPLPHLIARDFPAIDLPGILLPNAILGQAPAEARAFAQAVAMRNHNA